jgi:glycosyltransferase involved in cell wall biosynthesis
MAADLPVLGTAVGGMPELVEEGKSGMLVPPGDISSMANMMLTLLRDDELRRRMGAVSARIATERFDVSRMVNAYANLYETVSRNARTLPASV